MVNLITLFQASQYTYGIGNTRLIYQNHLEPTLQGFILFKILLILIKSCCSDSPQFPSCQGRLQDIGCVHCSISSAGSDQSMNFIYEKDYIPLGFDHLVNHTFQPLFEFAFILGTGNQSTHIQGVNLLVLQVLRNVFLQNPSSQSLHNGCFTHPGFTDQYRVVLRSTGQYLQDPPDFLIPSYHRV